MLYRSYRRRGYTRRNSMMYNQLIQPLLRYLQFNQRLMPFANVNYNLPTNYVVEAPVENGYKINSIDGNDCYKNTYRFVINRNDVEILETTNTEI